MFKIFFTAQESIIVIQLVSLWQQIQLSSHAFVWYTTHFVFVVHKFYTHCLLGWCLSEWWISTCTQAMTDITRTRLYNVDPLEPHFYIVKLGFTGVYIIFLFLLKNIDRGYSLEPPRRGGSNGYPQSMFWAEIWKILEFLSEKFHFLVVKFSKYLNRLVFVMQSESNCCMMPCVNLSHFTKMFSSINTGVATGPLPNPDAAKC